MSAALEQEIINLNQKLLDSIVNADWATYETLCDPTLTCFEPEAIGQLVEGMAFHQFYFNLGPVRRNHHTTMIHPHVRVMGDSAVIAYIRLNQRVGADGSPTSSAVEETRIWQKKDGRWVHVHFHRSPVNVR